MFKIYLPGRVYRNFKFKFSHFNPFFYADILQILFTSLARNAIRIITLCNIRFVVLPTGSSFRYKFHRSRHGVSRNFNVEGILPYHWKYILRFWDSEIFGSILEAVYTFFGWNVVFISRYIYSKVWLKTSRLNIWSLSKLLVPLNLIRSVESLYWFTV